MDCTNVFSKIADNTSRTIWENRVLFSLTGHEKYIDEISKTTEEYGNISNMLSYEDGAYIYGAGRYGRIIKRLFKDKFIAFLDQKAAELIEIDGMKVILPEQGDNKKRVYISAKFEHREIKEKLHSLGFDDKNIVNVGEMLENMMYKQYFDLKSLYHQEDETFVDVGGFDGGSILEFQRWSKNQYRRVYCFEPDEDNLNVLKKRISENDERIVIIPKGAWNEETVLHFNQSAEKSAITSLGNTKIPVCKLDDELAGEKVTFIKMDIEGAEYEALLGAEQIIKTYKPKLAICVYHKKEDIFKIPELIATFRNDYRFYFRVYTFSGADTVMYAL